MTRLQHGVPLTLGIALGSILGIVIDNLAIGIGLGVAFGAAGEGAIRSQTKPPDDTAPPANDADPPIPGR